MKNEITQKILRMFRDDLARDSPQRKYKYEMIQAKIAARKK